MTEGASPNQDIAAIRGKFKAHTITLEECYVLRDWLKETVLVQTTPASAQKLVAIMILGAVESLIIELENQP